MSRALKKPSQIGESDTMVNNDRWEEYVPLVVDTTIKIGIIPKMV